MVAVSQLVRAHERRLHTYATLGRQVDRGEGGFALGVGRETASKLLGDPWHHGGVASRNMASARANPR